MLASTHSPVLLFLVLAVDADAWDRGPSDWRCIYRRTKDCSGFVDDGLKWFPSVCHSIVFGDDKTKSYIGGSDG